MRKSSMPRRESGNRCTHVLPDTLYFPMCPSVGLSRQVFSVLPRSGVSFAFAYGSGALKQTGYDFSKKLPMLDVVICVNDPVSWHRENMQRNPGHYSLAARFLGPEKIVRLQRRMQAPIYYNTYALLPDTYIHSTDLIDSRGNGINSLHFPPREMKYGVISTLDAEYELQSWRSLFLPGRLHKPVVVLHMGSNENLRNSTEENDSCKEDMRVQYWNEEVSQYVRRNREAACCVAALLLGSGEWDVRDFFIRIASLSYIGDPRMGIAEHPEKIVNLVDGSFSIYEKIYVRIFDEMSSQTDFLGWDSERQRVRVQLDSVERLRQALRWLPPEFLDEIRGVFHERWDSVPSNIRDLLQQRNAYTAVLQSRIDPGFLQRDILCNKEISHMYLRNPETRELIPLFQAVKEGRITDDHRSTQLVIRLPLEDTSVSEADFTTIILAEVCNDGPDATFDDLRIVNDTAGLRSIIELLLSKRVQRPLVAQYILGLFSTGPLKTCRYVYEKIQKRLRLIQ